MQIKLHRWAVADHGFRFDDVFNFVCDPATLVVAFERVAGNTGARTAGVDGLRADHVQAFGAEAYLEQIRSQLRAGVFRPLPVRERMVPKAGGKLRRLGIPTIADRVVQAALKLVMEPIFEADFRPCSYGFRPNRRAHDAIAEIHLFGTQGYRWVLDADIEACFDRIDHAALMGRVRVRLKDKRVLALVKAFLKAGIMTELGERNETTSGTPRRARTPHPRPKVPAHPRGSLPRPPAQAPTGEPGRPRHSSPPGDQGTGLHRQLEPARPLHQPGPRRGRPARPLSPPRRLARYLLTRPDRLKDYQRERIEAARGTCHEMTALADLIHRFAVLLDPADGNAARLSTWITSAQAEDLPHLHAFTRGLEKDRAAVDAALTLPHHNGGTEGVNNKTKLIKRQMYGRASFPLLRHRILLG
ncbi:reverse transcriptase domain-containing protein [Streptomyces olivaceus]|uniref:reverse transcriptase domain-containing protein n=1 Tax=Streptomyces olivaceus TaxID=47716 RepID=UPI0037FF1CF4